jgi:hypothetical protein
MLRLLRSSMKAEGAAPPAGSAFAPPVPPAEDDAPRGNNYGRPEGQNVGNFLSDRPSSRVLAAPGGTSQVVFGDAAPEPLKKARAPACSKSPNSEHCMRMHAASPLDERCVHGSVKRLHAGLAGNSQTAPCKRRWQV